ncbi:MAG TPA: PASTA domain-containing protein [Acidimicrobiia bacterium]|jgi:hypothetical protein
MLVKPELAEVSPGQPVTAQGWNTLVSGLSDLYDEVLSMGRGGIEVNVLHDGTPVPGAQVVAVPMGDGQPVDAIPPFPGRSAYTLAGLSDGNWQVHVEADGFQTQTLEVTIPRDDPLPANLLLDGTAMPDLFGRELRSALNLLAEAGIGIDLIFDTTGRELPRASIPPEYESAPILVHSPSAGEIVSAAADARLVVASAIRKDPVVVMPSLIGLTYDEAAEVLERLGLRVGTTTVRSST